MTASRNTNEITKSVELKQKKVSECPAYGGNGHDRLSKRSDWDRGTGRRWSRCNFSQKLSGTNKINNVLW